MRKVVLYTLLSLDGVAESPDRFIFDFDDAMEENLADVIGTQDAVLLGRASYDEWAPYWPESDVEPFAGFINGVDKHVATSTELTEEWAGTSVVDGPVAAFVRELKAGDGGDIGVHASISLAQSLLREGVIAQLRLVVAPVVAGEGRRLFDGGAGTVRLDLVRSVASPSGALLLDYAVRPA
jgi:dihydrofolate reductase